MPAIARAFGTPLSGAIEWVVIVYLVTIAALLLTFGRTRLPGRRRCAHLRPVSGAPDRRISLSRARPRDWFGGWPQLAALQQTFVAGLHAALLVSAALAAAGVATSLVRSKSG